MRITQTTTITFKLPDEQKTFADWADQEKDNEWILCGVTSHGVTYARHHNWSFDIPKEENNGEGIDS